ncbi:MAG: hypothetical protein ACJAWW_000620 [Sulfurimonas sp.]|jgi:hypothetical protein
MYKNLLIILIIALFAGCSNPKPQQIPSWYTNPPKDYKNFYAVASAQNKMKAKNLAINALRKNINTELDASFQTTNHMLASSPKILEEIMKSNNNLCNKLSMMYARIEKSEVFNGEVLILLSVPREELFQKIKHISDIKFKELEKQYNLSKDSMPIQRYANIKPLMSQYTTLASQIAFEKISIATYSADNEFKLLKLLDDEYKKLQSQIHVYILSDGNSRIYTKSIKEAIQKEGLRTERGTKDDNTFKLIISSQTTNSQDYSFMVSSNLVKYVLFDSEKNKLLFRQHTFVGKSRKSYQDAKLQTALHQASKIKQLGIFDFIGLKNE